MAENRELEVRALREKLDLNGAHLTRQRVAVFAYLTSVDHHPTADDVFLAVKREIPRISLATVYKNLEALVACGAAAKLNYGDAAARYDSRTSSHYHTRCLACGRISDMDPVAESELAKLIQTPLGFDVKDYRIELTGYCSGCDSEVNSRQDSRQVAQKGSKQ